MAFVSSGRFDEGRSIFFGKLIFTGVVFMPTLILHFVILFLKEAAPQRSRRDLLTAYALTFLFLTLLWSTDRFITGIYVYSWGHFPKGGAIHQIHSVFVLATALYSVYLLKEGLKKICASEGKTKRYYETKSVFLAALFMTCAASDLLHNWGVDFFPIGFLFVTLFVIFITYGIFRHKLLGISIVIKNGLIYSVLVSILTAAYFTIVLLISSFIGDVTQVHAWPLILFIFAVITLIFKPLEQNLQKKLDKIVFKNPREVLEKELSLLKSELQKQDRLKAVATLAAGIAHEIKNPLTSIRTFAEYLPEKYDQPDFRQTFKKIVVDEVDRINDIVKQLLEFSKPEELVLKPYRVTLILDETLSLLSNNFLNKKIEVLRSYKEAPELRVDRNQLKQAFLNIFLNALQAMPRGGKITVSTFSSAQYHTIRIEDTGVGIPKEHLSRIFDPFFTTKESGTGLGLSIVHGIVTKHGGNIEISSNPDAGSTVHIYFKTENE